MKGNKAAPKRHSDTVVMVVVMVVVVVEEEEGEEYSDAVSQPRSFGALLSISRAVV